MLHDTVTLAQAIEAILFAAGEPMTVAQLRRVLRRSPCDLSALCQEEGSDGDEASDDSPSADSADTDAATAAQPQGDASADASEGDEGVVPASASSEDPAPQDSTMGGPDADAQDNTEQQDAVTLQGEQQAAFRLAAPKPNLPKTLSHAIRAALTLIARRWKLYDDACGFAFVEVAGGYTFRTKAGFGPVVAALKEERPPRLSRPAMESLSIVAYRQPVTKPEVDALRGVDSGGTLKVLLDRKLIGVVGKKEEPGRPLLYGTTDAFLSLFNLASLTALPSLREFNELNVDSEDALRAFDGLPSLAELSAGQKQFHADDAPSIDALDAAVEHLKSTEGSTRGLLLEHGVTLQDVDGQSIATVGSQPEAPGASGTLH